MKTTITQISNVFNLLSQVDIRLFNYHFGYRYDINQNIANNFDPSNDTGRLFPSVSFDVPDNVKYIDDIDYVDVQEEMQVTLYFDDLQGYNNDGSLNVLNPIEQWQSLKQISEDFIANFKYLFEDKYGAGYVGKPTFIQRANLYNDRLITWEVSFQLTHAIPCTDVQYQIDPDDFPNTLDEDDLERTTGTPITACDRIISQLNNTLLLTCVLPLYDFSQVATQNALSLQQILDLKTWLLPQYDFSDVVWQNLLTAQQESDLTAYLLPLVDFTDVAIQAIITPQQQSDIISWLLPLVDFSDPSIQAIITPTQQTDLQTWLCTPVPPTFDYSFLFNGVNQYIIGQTGGVYNLDNNTPFSISVWFTATSFASTIALLSKALSERGYSLAITTLGKVYLDLRSGSYINGNCISIISNNSFTAGVLNNVTITYSGNQLASGVEIYLNGVVSTKFVDRDGLGGTLINAQNIQIGATTTYGFYSNASINQCRMWDIALSPANAAIEGLGTLGKPNATAVNAADLIMNTDFDTSVFGFDTFSILDSSGASSGYKTINAPFNTRFVQP